MIAMIRKSTLLATLGIAWMATACTMDAPESELVSTAEIATTEQDITALCHVGANGSENYCTSSCTCGIGEADCDSSTQCTAGLKCHFNTGANYGFAADVDVCDCPLDSDNGGSSFCSALCPCDAGQGDCDSNNDPSIADCATGLTCYTDAGAAFGLDAEDDVCATCLPSSANGTIDFCNPGCPCSEGEGDCDSNTDCDPGLTCFLNVGADFGLPPDTEVCAACPPPSMNGHVNYCSETCPCSHGEGDCDSNTACEAGLTCVNNVGPQFGLPEGTDVCVDLTP
jgi:hypothetical protein